MLDRVSGIRTSLTAPRPYERPQLLVSRLNRRVDTTRLSVQAQRLQKPSITLYEFGELTPIALGPCLLNYRNYCTLRSDSDARKPPVFSTIDGDGSHSTTARERCC